MKIALVGYGKMGRAIEPIAIARGHQVVSIDPVEPKADFQKINDESLSGVDVAIEFTNPEVVIENIESLLKGAVRVVVGTTGWNEKQERIKQLCADTECGLVHGSNFSVGVNIFSHLLRQASKLINSFSEYDVSGLEFHHKHKKDSPSGTALSLAEIMLEEIERKERLVIDPLQREISEDELHFASVRCGTIPGTHEIVFDSEADTISLKHTARGRGGFALGSVLAAEWIHGKTGFHSVQDFMADLLPS